MMMGPGLYIVDTVPCIIEQPWKFCQVVVPFVSYNEQAGKGRIVSHSHPLYDVCAGAGAEWKRGKAVGVSGSVQCAIS